MQLPDKPTSEYSCAAPRFVFEPVQTRSFKALIDPRRPLGKAVFLKAPPGYGKTVLMSMLSAHLTDLGEECVWVGLSDQRASTELAVEALEDYLHSQKTPTPPTQQLFRGTATLDSRIHQVVQQLNLSTGQINVFLDNVKEDGNGSFGALLDALVFQTGDHVRIVWSGVGDTAFNLSRAHLEGVLRKIEFADLAFTTAETLSMLGDDLMRQLGSQGAVALTTRTEGWPAAIRVAKVGLDNSDQPNEELRVLSGSDDNLAEMLGRLTFFGFPQDFQDFLLRLGLLSKFNHELCLQAIGANGDKQLDALLAHNLLIIPLDKQRNYYRLHGLFQDYLRSVADRRLADADRRHVLQRATAWCVTQGFWSDAVDYALAIQDHALASQVLEKADGYFVKTRDGLDRFVEWVDRIRTAGVDIGLKTHYWYVWALVIQRRFEVSRGELKALYAHINDTPVAEAAAIEQRAAHLRICINLFTDRRQDVMHYADLLLEKKNITDPFTLGAVWAMKGLCQSFAFQFNQASQSTRVAETYLRQAGSEYFKMWITLCHVIPGIFVGNFKQGPELLLPAIRRMAALQGNDSKQVDILAMLTAKCYVEMGRDLEAKQWLDTGLRSVFNLAAQDSIDITSCGLDAAIKLWGGEEDPSLSIPRLREVVGHYPPRLSTMLSCYITQRLLRLGRVKSALGEAARIGLIQGDGKVSTSDIETYESARCREALAAAAIDLMVATGDLRGASLLIQQETQLATADGRTARLVELGLTKAMILMRRKSMVEAVQEVKQAISRATHGQIVRPLLDWSGLITDLLGKRKLSPSSFTLQEERDFFRDICAAMPQKFSQPQQAPLSHGGEPAFELTRREIQLLTMLEAGLANKQMVDEANISLGTIKWHLKNLYKKLGVTNRTAALAKVRSQNYISQSD